MKKMLIAALALGLLLAMCGAALADVGDVITTRSKAYYDALGNHYAGIIPADTSVMVNEYGPFISRIVVKNRTVYVATKTLKHSKDRLNHMTTLKKGVKVYQQPSFFSASAEVEKETRVYVCSVKGGWVMVRGGKRGVYAYVPIMDIEGAKLVK